MNFLKKFFGKSQLQNDSQEIGKPDIEKLINSVDINTSIIEVDNYICILCQYGDKLELLNEFQRNFYLNQNLEREVNNGGFNQFYFNSSGDFAHETIKSLKTIGANKTAEILKKANDQFPDNIVPKDRSLRSKTLEDIESKADIVWEELDQQFFAYEEDLNSLNMEYIIKNKNNF